MAIEPGHLSLRRIGPARMTGHQTGIALIHVLITFILITAIASKIVTSLWFHTEKNARYLERVQAKHYAMGAEQYIALLIQKDFEDDKKNDRMVDHANEPWNVKTVGYEVEQGNIEISVRDEQSLFNLNWLTDFISSRHGDDRRRGLDYFNMLENLLFNQSLDPKLAQKIKSWVSEVEEFYQTDNEDMLYLSMNPPRRTSQTDMASVSELALIDGFDHEAVEKLLPYITVIPNSSKLNFNTVNAEIIRSFHKGISEGHAQAIINSRNENGVANNEQLQRLVAMTALDGLSSNHVSFNSQYFSAQITATFRDTTFYLRTLFYRHINGKVQVVGREIGPSAYWGQLKREPEV